jgi:tellurite resistance protein TerC
MNGLNLLWLLFGVFIATMMALDLGVFHRREHTVKFKEACLWSAVWVGLALAYMGLVWWLHPAGHRKALEFLTGYLIEESLSVDNLFVFLLIFAYFRVPSEYQHNCLFWGILGAMIMRAAFIVAGVALLQRFSWIIYVFGLVLIYSGIKMGIEKDKEVEPEHNPVLKLFRRFVPVTKDYAGKKFFLKIDGRLWATPLFVVLLVIETTDVVFAVDSIPAVFGIWAKPADVDPFIVYTSNIFAIMGLRALYFALAGVMNLFHHLHYGLCVILVFIGGKMLASHWLHVPMGIALSVVAAVLVLSIVASLIWPVRDNMDSPSTDFPSIHK